MPQACHVLRHVWSTYYADTAFTADERRAIQSGTDAWFAFSDANIAIDIVFDDSEGPRVHKTWSTSPETVARDARGRESGDPTWAAAGWARGGDVWVVIDRIHLGQLRALIMHELGHVIGMRWPACDPEIYDCVHAPDISAIMYPSLGANEFNDSDRLMCLASCLCP